MVSGLWGGAPGLYDGAGGLWSGASGFQDGAGGGGGGPPPLPTSALIWFGDSTGGGNGSNGNNTMGVTAWLSIRLNREVFCEGRSGYTSQPIAARQGGSPSNVTVAIMPDTATYVAATSSINMINNPEHITGTVGGQHGDLWRQASFTFRGDGPGPFPTAAITSNPFITDIANEYRDNPQIWLWGANDTVGTLSNASNSARTRHASARAFIQGVGNSKFISCGLPLFSDEATGTVDIGFGTVAAGANAANNAPKQAYSTNLLNDLTTAGFAANYLDMSLFNTNGDLPDSAFAYAQDYIQTIWGVANTEVARCKGVTISSPVGTFAVGDTVAFGAPTSLSGVVTAVSPNPFNMIQVTNTPNTKFICVLFPSSPTGPTGGTTTVTGPTGSGVVALGVGACFHSPTAPPTSLSNTDRTYMAERVVPQGTLWFPSDVKHPHNWLYYAQAKKVAERILALGY